MSGQPRALSQWQLAPFHLGAFVGPISSAVVAVLFTVLMGAFHVDRSLLSLAIPVYMIPFAGVQLISGGISDLTSRRSTLLLGFTGYGIASLVSGLAPVFAVYLLGQALMGATNAFTSPIAMATLGDVVPDERVGRTMGVYSAVNISGSLFGPLLAGALGGLSWRLTYIAIAAMSWGLVVWYELWFRRHGETVPRRIRSQRISDDLRRLGAALGWPLALLACLAFLANGATRGPSYLFGNYLGDRFGAGVGAIGLILALYGLAGLFAGPFAGSLVDWAGVYPSLAVSMVGVAGSLVMMGLGPSTLVFAAGNFLLGVTSIVAWAALSTIALRATPETRGTTSSIFGSARFLAQALAPLLFTPLYQAVAPDSIFLVAALMGLVLLAPLLGLYRLTERRARLVDTETAAR